MAFFEVQMAGVPMRSGGHNRKSVEAHVLSGTFRKDRHAAPTVDTRPVSPAVRRRTLQGLTPGARRLAGQLLEAFAGWDPSSLTTLRAYALSCERLEALQAAGNPDSHAVAREVRINLGLLRALNLEVAR
jgi:hypothetical protein